MRPNLAAFAWLSIAAAVVTMGLKLLAWHITGSVGLLSDALESLVNLGAASMLLLMLRLAAAPADEGHPYGHSKAEYFSSGFEGMLVIAAGACIVVPAVSRLLHPQPLQDAPAGLLINVLATAINYAVARALGAAGRRHDSAALRADSAHLMTDVWTSVGVVAGVALAAATGWFVLDPLVALAVAGWILLTGTHLMREALTGLMDAAWPEAEQRLLEAVLARHRASGIGFHAVRTRQAGARRFVSFHVLVPGDWTVQRGHDLLETIEAELAAQLAHVTVFTHLEPVEDPASYRDIGLDRDG